jgi:hypothetical protein
MEESPPEPRVEAAGLVGVSFWVVSVTERNLSETKGFLAHPSG